MVTTGAEPIFIDTNVLVFASVPASPWNATATAAIHQISQSGAAAWISRQIVREFLVYLSRPGVLPVSNASSLAARQTEALTKLYRVADETQQVTRNLFDLLKTIGASGKQIHDANIVATMLTYGVPRLLTHNVADFRRCSSLIQVVPLQPPA